MKTMNSIPVGKVFVQSEYPWWDSHDGTGWCQRCGKGLQKGQGGYSVHHRKGRHCMDAEHVSNLVLLCGSGTTGCHGWCHRNPRMAYQEGWMIERNSKINPRDVVMKDVRFRDVQPWN